MTSTWQTNPNIRRIAGIFLCGTVLAALMMSRPAVAQSPMPPEDQALFGKAQSLNNMNRFEEAVPLLEGLREKYPQDEPVTREWIKACGYSRQYSRIAGELDELLRSRIEDKDLRLLIAGVLEANQKFAEARTIYEEFLREEPQNPQWSAKLGDLSLWIKDETAAAQYYESSLAAQSGQTEDPQLRMKWAEVETSRRDYAKAGDIYRQILKSHPDHQDAKLRLARVLSWGKLYEESLSIYGELIRENPTWVLPRRERARVLGWMRSYRQAVEGYAAALRDLGESGEIRAEKAAKEAFYKNQDTRAITAYRAWQSLEPEDPEMLFDLGQVYARQGRWSEAERTLDDLLALIPQHNRAPQVKDKVLVRFRYPLVREAVEFYEADSDSRFADVRSWAQQTSVAVPWGDKLEVGLEKKIFWYAFPRSTTHVVRQKITSQIAFLSRPGFWARGGYAYNVYSDEQGSSHLPFADLHWQVLDPLLVSLTYDRRDVVDNVDTLDQNLRSDNAGWQLVYQPHRRLKLGGDVTFSDLSDGNERWTSGLDVEAVAFYEPRRLSALYRFERYGYEDPSAIYFSPDNFHSHNVGWEWQHFLNREELFWGSQDTDYLVRYLMNFDVGGQRGHTVFLRFHKDLTSRFGLGLEAAKKIYEHQSIYDEDRIMVHAQYDF